MQDEAGKHCIKFPTNSLEVLVERVDMTQGVDFLKKFNAILLYYSLHHSLFYLIHL